MQVASTCWRRRHWAARLMQPAVRAARRVLPAVALAGTLVVPWASSPAHAAEVGKASVSRQTRTEATSLIPWDHLTDAQQQQVNRVLDEHCVFRRLPTQVIRCDPDLFLFTLNNPEVLVSIWKLLGLEDVKLQRLSATQFVADDGAGTLGNVEVLYSNHDTHLVYGEGSYDGPLFAKPVKGRCVMLLKSGYVREPDGNYYVTTRLDTFIQLDNIGLELLAKTFHPLVGRVADHNFAQTVGFVQNLSIAAESNPHGMHRLADKMDELTPEVRQGFIEVTAGAAQRADERRRYADPGWAAAEAARLARQP